MEVDMIGDFLTSLYSAFLVYRDVAWQEVYRRSIKFLGLWYLFSAVVLALLWGLLLAATPFSLVFDVLSFLAFGPLAGLLAFISSVFFFAALTLLLSLFRVVGVYFLGSALEKKEDNYSWNPVKLVVGLSLSILGLFVWPG